MSGRRAHRASCASSPSSCSAYGARMPKELMLFVKDILFLDGAMALMAPDVDLLGEIMNVVMLFPRTPR